MWTVDRLREAAAARGEMLPMTVGMGRAMLAHERLKGRTEESYPQEQARQDLDAALRTLDPASIPAARSGEYVGLSEFRNYAVEHAKPRQSQRAPAKEKDRDR